MAFKSLATSGIVNFNKYQNALVGNAPYIPSDFDLISTTRLASSQSSVSFDVSTLASTYKHLQIRFSIAGYERPWMRFNGATSYYTHFLFGNGSSVGAEGFSANGMRIHSDFNMGTSQFMVGTIDILDAFSTTKNKTSRSFVARNGSGGIQLSSGLWESTSAITSISFAGGNTGYGGDIYSGSRFSLYGIKG